VKRSKKPSEHDGIGLEKSSLPKLIAQASENARARFIELFDTQHCRVDDSDHARPIFDFLDWGATQGIRAIDDVTRAHILAWLQIQRQSFAASTAKSRLIRLQALFAWMASGGALARDPSVSVRPPIVVERKHRMPGVLPELAIALIESIKLEVDRDYRDRALIAMMVLRPLKSSEAVAMNVDDIIMEDDRIDPLIRDRHGATRTAAALLPLADCVRDYIDRCDLRSDRAGPLFRTARMKTGDLTIARLRQPSVRYLLRQRALAAGMLIVTSKNRLERLVRKPA
jgi:site-specific recombinase XerD